MNNHSVYANEELDSWKKRSGLLEQERYLIEKYIGEQGRLIEAGTGGGRISLEISNKRANLDIIAFDFVEDMIKSAKNKSKTIDFRINDASDLSCFTDESFNFAIYLQQIISFVPVILIPKVVNESYRILKKDGVILFSFLDFDSRKINHPLSFLVNIFRFYRGDQWQKQALPWLKLAGKPNYKLFQKNQAVTYWFKKKEIVNILKNAGFKIIELTVKNGMIYISCRK